MTEESAPQGRVIGWVRIGIGLAQGVILYVLERFGEGPSGWAVQEPALYTGGLAMAFLAPLVLIGGLGRIRPRTLIPWAVAAAVVAGGSAAYRVWADDMKVSGGSFAGAIFIAIGLFIAHHLIEPADAERRPIAPYAAYFDSAWRNGFQLVLAIAFVGAFWLSMLLGAGLFQLIGISDLWELIEKPWFRDPVSGLVFAAGVQLTYAKASLVNGTRTVALTLLSWLTPVMAVLAASFLVTLPFAGLDKLFKALSASGLMLGAAGALIILVNTIYQDGDEERFKVFLLRWAGRVAAVILIPLVGLAVYGLGIRVHQYGLTPERVMGLAAAAVGAVYAGGYLWAAVRPGPWMKGLRITNIVAAFVMIGVLCAVLSPLADPVRLSVASQMARLKSGAVTPEKFDYKFMRFHGGRYGAHALAELNNNPNAVIAERARKAILADYEFDDVIAEPHVVNVYPEGRALPPTFVDQMKQNGEGTARRCLRVGPDCVALFADFNGDGKEEILIGNGNRFELFALQGLKWTEVGSTPYLPCHVDIDNLKNGDMTAGPRGEVWKDVVIKGRSIPINPVDPQWRCD